MHEIYSFFSIELRLCPGIGRNTRTEKESREEDYTVWETRYRGLCRTTEYYVGIPAKRRVDFDKEVTTFQLNTENIKVCISSINHTLADLHKESHSPRINNAILAPF